MHPSLRGTLARDLRLDLCGALLWPAVVAIVTLLWLIVRAQDLWDWAVTHVHRP